MATDIGLTVCHCELTCSSLGVHVRSEGSVRSRFGSFLRLDSLYMFRHDLVLSLSEV